MEKASSSNNVRFAPPPPEVNENEITIVEEESEEESDTSSEFNFAATLELRKNLTETFDQHVHSNSVTEKIAHLEQRTAAAAALQKPPRQQQPQQKPDNNAADSRHLQVYLRLRPIPTNQPPTKSRTQNVPVTNTVEILQPAQSNDVSTRIRTYPPLDSNAAKVVRDGGSESLSTAELKGGVKEYDFQQVLGPDTSQKELYTAVAAPMVHGLFPAPHDDKSLVGESALLFAYGITNAGKTHTIMGNFQKKKAVKTAAPYEKWGVVPRALHDVFAKIDSHSQQKYNVHLSYLEIYQEHIFDLLPKEKYRSFGVHDGSLRLREGPNGETFVRGLSKHRVRDISHGLELAERAQTKRHTSSNSLNADSSRSHCICQLELTAVRDMHLSVRVNDDNDSVSSSASGYNTDEEAAHISSRKHKTVTMWIVDLAGSERSKRTGNGAGARQKEASSINASLMTLMRCLSTMGQKHRQQSSRDILRYRESKLTHLFMNHLSGRSASRTCMIVNINPASTDFDETQHVLSYAVAAKSVQISLDDYMKKRNAINGHLKLEATHGYDGRPLKPKAATKRPNKIARLVKKFSPKNRSPKRTMAQKRAAVPIAKEEASKKAKPGADAIRKRKAELLNMRGTATAPQSEVELGPKAKVRRTGEKSVKDKTEVPKTTTMTAKAATSYEKEIQNLKTSLMIAKAEAEVLRSEKNELQEEMSYIEQQVRIEVAEETEEQMRDMRAQYVATIDRLKLQIQTNPTPAKSIQKARRDEAERAIEDLIDKVDECEEEMVRMRDEFELEKAQLEEDHHAAIEVKEEEIEALKSSYENVNELQSSSEQKVKDLQEKLEALQKDNDRLRKESKAKGRMPLGAINSSLNTSGPGSQGLSKSTNPAAKNDHPFGTAPSTNKHATKVSFASDSENPADLSEVDSEMGDDDDEDNLLYPKKPALQDGEGAFQRPRGRAPSGREWDKKKGAWRLSIM